MERSSVWFSFDLINPVNEGYLRIEVEEYLFFCSNRFKDPNAEEIPGFDFFVFQLFEF